MMKDGATLRVGNRESSYPLNSKAHQRIIRCIFVGPVRTLVPGIFEVMTEGVGIGR